MHIISLCLNFKRLAINDISSSTTPKITGVINKEINAIDSMEFNIYPDNPGYNHMDEFQTRIESVNEDWELEFYGRILKTNPCLNSSGAMYKVVVCEGYLAFLQDSSLGYKTYKGTLASIINEIFEERERLLKRDRFVLKECCYDLKEVSIDSEGETVYEFIMNKIIAVYGGEIELNSVSDKTQANSYYKIIEINITNKEVISTNELKFGDNLIEFSMDKDMTNLCTYVVPYGAKKYTDEDNLERIDITSVNGGKNYLKVDSEYGIISKTLLESDIDDPAELKKAGEKYIEEHKTPAISYNITAFDNHYIDPEVPRIQLGKLHYVSIPIFGIDKLLLKITKQTMQIENPANDTFTVGNAPSTGSSLSGSGVVTDTNNFKSKLGTVGAIRHLKDVVNTNFTVNRNQIRKVTKAQYNAMKTHNSKALYVIKEDSDIKESTAKYTIEFGEMVGNGTFYFTRAYQDKPYFQFNTSDETKATITLNKKEGNSSDIYVGATLSGVKSDTVTLLVFYCTLPDV